MFWVQQLGGTSVNTPTSGYVVNQRWPPLPEVHLKKRSILAPIVDSNEMTEATRFRGPATR